MRGLVTTFAFLAGCGDIFDLVPVTNDAGGADSDSDVDAAACPSGTFGHNGAGGTGLFMACLATNPQAVFETPMTIDTREPAQCTYVAQPFGFAESVCMITAVDIHVASMTRAIGSMPLVLLATGDILIDSVLDAGSFRTGVNGAGNNYASCPSGVGGANGSVGKAGAGGAGGSYQTTGAAGGVGEAGASAGGAPAFSIGALEFVRGGCRGGQGGLASVTSGGSGGASGGAVYLIAGSSIRIKSTGLINASAEAGGGGGRSAIGGQAGGGGGGGGSGGLIGLDAPMVLLESGARLVANGGGGGGGAGLGGTGAAGDNGNSANTATYPFVASGGTGQTSGGAGANATQAAAEGENGLAAEGGAGGGGGMGYIKIYSTDLVDQGALSSPAHN